METVDPEAFAIWALTSTALFAKVFANSLVQAVTRMRHRRFVREEDARLFGRGAAPRTTEHPLVERMSRAWHNDLENIPFFLVLSLGVVLAGGRPPWVLGYCGAFVLARVSHTIFYAIPRQPHRNLSYQLGILSTFGCGGHLLLLTL